MFTHPMVWVYDFARYRCACLCKKLDECFEQLYCEEFQKNEQTLDINQPISTSFKQTAQHPLRIQCWPKIDPYTYALSNPIHPYLPHLVGSSIFQPYIRNQTCHGTCSRSCSPISTHFCASSASRSWQPAPDEGPRVQAPPRVTENGTQQVIRPTNQHVMQGKDTVEARKNLLHQLVLVVFCITSINSRDTCAFTILKLPSQHGVYQPSTCSNHHQASDWHRLAQL